MDVCYRMSSPDAGPTKRMRLLCDPILGGAVGQDRHSGPGLYETGTVDAPVIKTSSKTHANDGLREVWQVGYRSRAVPALRRGLPLHLPTGVQLPAREVKSGASNARPPYEASKLPGPDQPLLFLWKLERRQASLRVPMR
jgi:hypothetical protein